MNRISVSPRVLRWARERAGLAVADLEAKFPHLADWEAEQEQLTVQRYMSYAMDELADPNKTVRGAIIVLEDDLKLQRTLRATTNVDFYRYQVSSLC